MTEGSTSCSAIGPDVTAFFISAMDAVLRSGRQDDGVEVNGYRVNLLGIPARNQGGPSEAALTTAPPSGVCGTEASP